MDNIGQKIKNIRKEHKDTLKSLASKVDYDWSNLSKVERGIYGASVELLKKITEVYNISPTYFFGEGFTEPEGKLLVDGKLEPSDLREKFNFVVDGKEATEEEIEEAIRLIRYFRSTKPSG
ncbi:helix-turn-helix domain-containing protein [Heyndrickxia sp. MSNUG]|uniref:helix-turn-helix domain-containing protein n=1 Tax=Heyndrickxia sp. MSNUG TaxID=3136677 RepID=UPI003C2B4C48